MRIFVAALFTLLYVFTFGQNSEDLIPKHATSVFSINNVNLLQKISLDELVKYEFMEEVQQELFDGSTSGKTLKDSGIDFDQKMNVFFGRSQDFEIAGFTFGVLDSKLLFDVFDDFQPMESNYEGVQFYASYFNRIAIQGNSAILLRLTPSMNVVDAMADSIWYARGNDYPWSNSMEELERLFDDLELEDESTEEIEFFEEMETEENTITPIEVEELPVADEDPTTKTYWELRDSVELALQLNLIDVVCDELFVQQENLKSSSPKFVSQLTSSAEGTFYLDNSRNLQKTGDFLTLKSLYPNFYGELEELYKGNIMTGDLVLNDHSVELQLDANYGEKLGSIYKEMTDTKFDKNVFKYIHKDNSAFFTYRINLHEAYEQMYDVLHPMLESEAESDVAFSSSLLFLELWDEFIDNEAIFDTYRGSMFGTYSGIQKVKTTKFIFEYDEETFEYTEEEVEAEEDMPLFTLGFSTGRNDITEKILRHIDRIEEDCHKEADYWVFDRAIFNAAPLYVLPKGELFILTNDETLVKQYSDGYGSDALSKAMAKKVKKSGFMYGFADLGKAIENVPSEIFNDEENEMLDVIRGKSGVMEFTSTESSNSKTSFNLRYQFEGEYDASGTYILDLINSLYVISK